MRGRDCRMAALMTRRTWSVAALLFFSGLCALIYQTVWMREFRLVFGASTAATAAVLAIFMGGLGAGSAIFGKKADTRTRPLGLYANFEFVIAASAALSIPLLWIVRHAYLATGGSLQIGMFAATAARLVLAAIVLAIPTLAMGGTLPAAARAVETDADARRRNVALLYGVNTVGAVAGTLISTFFLLETFGNRRTLLIAVLLNLLIALVARSMSDRFEVPLTTVQTTTDGVETAGDAPLLIFMTAGVVGFAFLLMELVWYRMLGPLLGGTTFTFGLILAIALLGIGLGGLAYSAWNRATLRGLALTTACEALAVIVPFAFGDRIAIAANILRRLGDLGFGGHVLGWSVIALLTVFPAAFISGIQFPLLIALLGRGTDNVGRHVGMAYAWNTAGAIAGSLAGGFGLLPIMSAPGAWRAVTVILAVLAMVIPLASGRPSVRRKWSPASLLIAVVALSMLGSTGPTALWRHSGIGVGRLDLADSPNAYRRIRNDFRRRLIWDADGRESGVALLGGDDLFMIVNGKSDGSATGDSGTQVMSGLIGALIHGHPESALVIGLGTGTTAGWLSKIPGMKRVDVVELEAVSLDIAKACGAVNEDVLHRPNVRIDIADAREVLLTTPRHYDVIFSEPSNPYRAGIASLFTTEYYEASAKRLSHGGVFVQWMQAYAIDAPTLRTVYATLREVFPYVETYWTTPGDLVLVAAAQPIVYDTDNLRRLVASEPYRSGLRNTWRTTSLEGFLSHYVANEKTASRLASEAMTTNTDDRTPIEFSFARTINASSERIMSPLMALAAGNGEDRPLHVRGAVDWSAVQANRATQATLPISQRLAQTEAARHDFAMLFARGDLPAAANVWRSSDRRPINVGELTASAEALADVNDDRTLQYVQLAGQFDPGAADAIMARWQMRRNRPDEATAWLRRAFTRYRTDPWCARETMRRGIGTAVAVAQQSREYAPALYDALNQPFAAAQLDYARRSALLAIASRAEGCGPHTLAALQGLEPYVPWQRDHLLLRAQCYANAGLTDAARRARNELDQFEDAEPETLK